MRHLRGGRERDCSRSEYQGEPTKLLIGRRDETFLLEEGKGSNADHSRKEKEPASAVITGKGEEKRSFFTFGVGDCSPEETAAAQNSVFPHMGGGGKERPSSGGKKGEAVLRLFRRRWPTSGRRSDRGRLQI